MSLAPYIHAMGRGPSRARSLTRDEAQEAMTEILSGRAAPEAVGALLMLMRYRGETAAEVAGFADALRASLPVVSGLRPALDWPSYAAGRSRGLPWFLLSARLVASAGFPVLIHGWNSHQSAVASVRCALAAVGISQAKNLHQAGEMVDQRGLVYLPLEILSPAAMDLLRLRDVLGLRSAINTVLRVHNPADAGASVQGVFHPPYRELQADACALLGQQNMTVLKGGGGEFECHPSKDVALFGLRNGISWTGAATPRTEDVRRLSDADPDPADLVRLWRGEIDDPFATAIVVGTAALALGTLGCADPQILAEALWMDRGAACAA